MRILVVVVMVALFALIGVRAATVEESWADMLVSLVLGILFAACCFADARRRRRSLPNIAGFAILVLWQIAVPVYLLATRGLRRGTLLALGLVVAQVGIVVLAYLIASLVCYGDVAEWRVD